MTRDDKIRQLIAVFRSDLADQILELLDQPQTPPLTMPTPRKCSCGNDIPNKWASAFCQSCMVETTRKVAFLAHSMGPIEAPPLSPSKAEEIRYLCKITENGMGERKYLAVDILKILDRPEPQPARSARDVAIILAAEYVDKTSVDNADEFAEAIEKLHQALAMPKELESHVSGSDPSCPACAAQLKAPKSPIAEKYPGVRVYYDWKGPSFRVYGRTPRGEGYDDGSSFPWKCSPVQEADCIRDGDKLLPPAERDAWLDAHPVPTDSCPPTTKHMPEAKT